MKHALFEFSHYGIDTYKLSSDVVSIHLILNLREKINLLLSLDELIEITSLPVKLVESKKIKLLIIRYLDEVVKI